MPLPPYCLEVILVSSMACLVAVVMNAYNTFNSSNLGNYSPFELTFGRKLKVLVNTETNPGIKVSTNFREYYNLLNKRIKYLQDILFNLRPED